MGDDSKQDESSCIISLNPESTPPLTPMDDVDKYIPRRKESAAQAFERINSVRQSPRMTRTRSLSNTKTSSPRRSNLKDQYSMSKTMSSRGDIESFMGETTKAKEQAKATTPQQSRFVTLEKKVTSRFTFNMNVNNLFGSSSKNAETPPSTARRSISKQKKKAFSKGEEGGSKKRIY